MKWKEILRKDKYALLQSESDTQYAVVDGYDSTQPENQQWSAGTYFTYWDDSESERKAAALSNALDLFRYRTESKYISRNRLEELATKFKDGVFGADLEDEEYEEFFAVECEMEDYEKNFFGIGAENE